MNTTSTIRAPGKAFLCGEYAVLHGAQALVAAIDACVIIQSTPANTLTIHSDLLPQHPFTPDSDRNTDPPPLKLLRTAIDTLAHLQLPLAPPASLHISSATLRRHHKLGLGSSGAVAAALACALLHPGVDNNTVQHAALTIHRTFQQGKGSGGDVLASLHGGLLRMRDANAQQTPCTPTIALLPTSTPADTPSMIQALHQWSDEHPARWKLHLDALTRTAEYAANAASRNDLDSLFRAIHEYASLEEHLTRDSHVPIITPELATVIARAEQAGWTAKPSGAGGGDLVIAMAPPHEDETTARARLAHTLANTPWTPLPLGIHQRGALHYRGTDR